MNCNERILRILETTALPVSLDELRNLAPDIEQNELNSAILDLAFQEEITLGKRGVMLSDAKAESSTSPLPCTPAPANCPPCEHEYSELPPWPWPEFADEKPARPLGEIRQGRTGLQRGNAAPVMGKKPMTPDIRKKYASLDSQTATLAKNTLISDILDYAPILKRLKSIGVFTIADYTSRKESEILAIRGFGVKKLEDVNGAIDQWMAEAAGKQSATIGYPNAETPEPAMEPKGKAEQGQNPLASGAYPVSMEPSFGINAGTASDEAGASSINTSFMNEEKNASVNGATTHEELDGLLQAASGIVQDTESISRTFDDDFPLDLDLLDSLLEDLEI